MDDPPNGNICGMEQRGWDDGGALACPHGHAFTLRADGTVIWDDFCAACETTLVVDHVAA